MKETNLKGCILYDYDMISWKRQNYRDVKRSVVAGGCESGKELSREQMVLGQ